MIISTGLIIAVSVLLFFIIILSMIIITLIKDKEYILAISFVFFLFLLGALIFVGINSEIEENVKHDKYEKIILYNECETPTDTTITLIK